ncbi:MAG: hypothetical protein ABI053_02940 [Lacisediminihabitans sp.]
MTDPTTATRASEGRALQNWAIVLSSLVIPLPILVSKFVEAILKSANPAKVDVTQGLAYLSELLGWGFGSLGILLIVIIVVYVIIYRREKTLDALKVPLTILAIQIVAGIAILIFGGIASNAMDNYAKMHQ